MAQSPDLVFPSPSSLRKVGSFGCPFLGFLSGQEMCTCIYVGGMWRLVVGGALPCCLLLTLCLLLTAVAHIQGEWSSYHASFSFQCRLGKSVATVKSVYSAVERDRKFSISCRDLPLVSQRFSGVCSWKGQSNHARTHTHTHAQ